MLLDRIGPAAFDAALRRVGVTLRFDRRHGPATLPLALGGAGLTLEELVRLYTALPSGGVVRPVGERGIRSLFDGTLPRP